MDHPYYTVTVASLTRGWSYTTTEGPVEDDDADVQLEDKLNYRWGFRNELLPGQLDTFTAVVNLAGKSATVLPEVQVGDLITIDVRIGTTGPRIIAPPPFRAAEPSVTLRARSKYPARMEIPLTDLSVDWRSQTLGTPLGQPNTEPGGDKRDARPYWRERGAEIAVLTSAGGVSIGCPTWWADDEDVASTLTGSNGRPYGGMAYDPWGGKMYEGNLDDVLERFLNTHQPDGFTHTWVTVYDPAGHPTGYRRIGPDTWVNALTSAIPAGGPLSDPATAVRIEAVPASRKLSGDAGFPLILTIVAGLLAIVPREPGVPTDGYATQLGLDADWCSIPATARRARDSVANFLNLLGYGTEPSGTVDAGGDPEYSFAQYAKHYSTADATLRGLLARDVPTMLALGQSDTGAFFTGSIAAAAVAGNFLSDPSAVAAQWSYDAFTMRSSLVPQDVAEWLLPKLAPRLPDEEDGDGILIRHLTIFDLESDIRFSGQPVMGFTTGGSLEIRGGDIVWTFATAPGRPVWTDAAPTPITLDDLVTYFGTLTFNDVGPHIQFGDLAYVEGTP